MKPVAAKYPVSLTIAGSDSSGGAGLQADLKTFAAFGVYGASAVTAVTAQNTTGVRAVHLVPATVVRAQIEAVLEDLPVTAAKIGMLGGEAQASAVAEALAGAAGLRLVLDPVIVATSGDRLLRPEAVQVLLQRLLPMAVLVTPNLPEARLLAGMGAAAGSAAEAVPAVDLAQALLDRGARAVLVKGGHAAGDVIEDLLAWPGSRRLFRHPRVATGCTHGTGCTLSAAVVAGLSRGYDLEEAVALALDYLQQTLDRSWPLGQGHGPVHHFFQHWQDSR